MQKIKPFLWFDGDAEDAAKLYCSIFPNSKIVSISHYGDAGPGEKNSVMGVTFELDGQEFIGLNGGPQFQFSEAISFFVECKNQEEVDEYWDKLLAGGGQPSQCGWLKDRFGLSWQIVPSALGEMLGDPDREKASRVMEAMMKMVKIEIPELQRAYNG
jgi:predicted 3-demethylubiquinone-9 3-methyltransferase (glyoxalase superfamily)